MGALLERPPAEIVAFASRRHARGGRGGRRSASGEAHRPNGRLTRRASPPRCSEGPAACLRRAERRPPGDLVVAWSEPLYPDQLRDLDDPPLCLFVRGGADDGDGGRPALGARRRARWSPSSGRATPSPYGEEMARSSAATSRAPASWSSAGWPWASTPSPQAAAVDAAVRRCARARWRCSVAAPTSCTRASNARLYARVAGGGLVVSEFTWGVPARAWRFPARNRVMAALGRAVVLVEGAERSGARITASFAADLGRTCCASPARRAAG